MVVCFREHAPVAILAANSKRHFRAAWTVMKDCRCHFAWHCVYSLKRARPVGLSGVRRQVYYRSTWFWFRHCWFHRIGPLWWLRISSGPRHCPVGASFLVFLSTPEAYMRGRLIATDTSQCIHVNLERKFRGTKWRPTAKRSETGFGWGVRGSSHVNFQKPVLQMVQSDVFLSYICEYN